MANKITLVGLDVDGVILDTLSGSYSTDSALIKQYDGIIPSLDEYRKALKETDWTKFYGSFGVKEEFIPLLEKEYYARLPKSPSAIPHAKENLERILKSGRGLFLASKCENKDVLLERLENAGLLKYLDQSRIYAVRKSKADVIKGEMSNGHKAKCIFVGDTVKDITEANEAGAISVAKSDEYSYGLQEDLLAANPKYIINSLSHIAQFLR